MKKLSITSIIFFLSLCLSGAREHFIYKQVSLNEGFTSTVNCIYKEKDGDVWLGTPNGLYRYNGYQLTRSEEAHLDGRKIYQVTEDLKGNLWVLTDSCVMMRRNGEEHLSKLMMADNSGDEERSFFSICPDKEGVWLGSNGKLFHFSYADDSLRIFKDMKERSSFWFTNLCHLDDRTLFCSSHNGIIVIDTVTGNIKESFLGSYREVSSALIDSRGNIWLALYNRGIEVYDKDGRLLRRYNTETSTLNNNVVLCMTERNSKIWTGTDGGGINILDLDDDKVVILSHISGDSSSFPAHSIKSIHADSYGNIWAGSIRDGLVSVSSSHMMTYGDSHIGMDTGLSNPTVLFLHQDMDSEHIWIGTDGEGLNRFDPATGEFTHYASTLKTKVVAIADYSEEELALSLYSDRIVLFNKTTGKTRDLDIRDDDLNYRIKYAGRTINMTNEADGNILFICNTINRLDISSGECSTVYRGGNDNIFVLGKSKEGIWMHDFHCIYLLPTGATALEPKGRLDEASINGGDVCSMGIAWLATDKGLYRFEPSAGTFTHIRTSLFTGATSAICDNHSRIWVGTEQNLYAYLTESDSFAMFGESDGASPNEYLSKPRLHSREGDIYMGGVKGLLCIYDEFSIEATEVPGLKLYSLFVDGEAVERGRRGVYEIPRHSKTMNINLSTLEKDIFRNKMYRFIFSKEGPLYEKASPSLNIQQLPKAGRYDISVSCTKRNGNWTEPMKIATISIPRPWYLSGWFIGSIVILLGTTLVTFLMYSSHKKANMLQLALKEQEQRVYEEKVQMLINVSHELRTPLTLIMAPLKRILNDKETSDKYSETLGRIYRQSRRMKDMLNMVLDLRKMEVGKNSLKIESINFNKWLESSIEDIIAEEHAEGIDIMLETDPAITEVDMDVRKCDTVLMNILINAIKHSAIGDTITIKTRLSGEGSVIVSVSDQGPGLGDTDMSELFTRFYQNSREQYGSGIGLSYSKILIELMGGKIGAQDNEDKGATFWWEIPVTAEFGVTPVKAYLNELLGYNPGEEITVPETRSIDTSGMTLMLVDDNADLLDFLKESLQSEFREILLASSGNKALKMIESGNIPDLIVSDVNMSDGDGYKLCKEIKDREKYSHIPVVLLSAHRQEESQNESYKIGAEAFLPKPFEIDTLLELVRNILARKAEIKKMYLKADNEGSYGSKEEGFILQLNRVIAEHMSDPELDQLVLCRELGMSRAALYNKMKAITGAGAKEYITRIRLEKAKTLVETTGLSIVEISEMTGFTSQSYFSTAFKAYTGMTPSQYKKQKASS